MGIFDKKNKYFDFSVVSLRDDLLIREQSAEFSYKAFEQFAQMGLFQSINENTKETDLNVLIDYYNIARASLDLPFTSSLAAHGFVSCLMLHKWGSESLKQRFSKVMADGQIIGAISNSEDGTSTNLKEMKALIKWHDQKAELNFIKPCVTNGGIAHVLLTSLWSVVEDSKPQLELYLLLNEEVKQKSLSSELTGFRTGNTGSILGGQAQPDIHERRLTQNTQTVQALRYCFFIERLIVAVMATGLAHGVEDYLLHEAPPKNMLGITADQKQYLQEKVLQIHIARVQMTSLLESIIQRGATAFLESESELSVLKLMISQNLRPAVFAAMEVVGHRSVFKNHLLPKVLKDLEMCSFFGGTQELQKLSLYNYISNQKARLKVA